MKTPEGIKAEALAATKQKRLQFTRVLDFIGVIVLAIGAINFSEAVQFIPEIYVPWVTGLGALMARIQAVILFVGDFIDDGQLNKSYRIPK